MAYVLLALDFGEIGIACNKYPVLFPPSREGYQQSEEPINTCKTVPTTCSGAWMYAPSFSVSKEALTKNAINSRRPFANLRLRDAITFSLNIATKCDDLQIWLFSF